MLDKRLRQIRLEHNMTQKEVADVLGIDRTTYTFYETGTTTPSPGTLHKLSHIYNVTIGYLMGVEENHPERLRKTKAQMLSSPPDPIADLSGIEKKVLMFFRLLNEEQQQKVLDLVMQMVAENEEPS